MMFMAFRLEIRKNMNAKRSCEYFLSDDYMPLMLWHPQDRNTVNDIVFTVEMHGRS